MKIFERDGKINFVDDNNVFVGFDYSQDCCENFGYLLTKVEPTSIASESLDEEDWPGYQFVTTFFNDAPLDGLEDGGAAMFKLAKTGEPDLFLTLYNSHNGYYGHGFTMTVGEATVQDGFL